MAKLIQVDITPDSLIFIEEEEKKEEDTEVEEARKKASLWHHKLDISLWDHFNKLLRRDKTDIKSGLRDPKSEE